MKELVIKVKGTVPYVTDWDEKRKLERYAEGEGLYAQMQGEQIVGLIAVYDFNVDAPASNCQFQEFLFNYVTVAEIMMRESEDKLKEFIAEGFEKIIKDNREGCYHIEKALTEVCEDVKRIGESGGSVKGITEKTLLSALSIVTRGGTDNGKIE